MNSDLRYQSILVKVSGEMMGRIDGHGAINWTVAARLGQLFAEVGKLLFLAFMVGGGNIIRAGRDVRGSLGIREETLDHMAMMGLVVTNSAVAEATRVAGGRVILTVPYVQTTTGVVRFGVICSALDIEPYSPSRVRSYKQMSGYVVGLAGGTGEPGCTTDKAAAIRADEIGVDAIVIVKNGKDVRGIHRGDPELDPSAPLIERTSYGEVLGMTSSGIEPAAIEYLCELRKRPAIHVIGVSDLTRKENVFIEIVRGANVGTFISPD